MSIPSYSLFIDLANTREDMAQATAEDRYDTARPYVTRSYRRRFVLTFTAPVGPGLVREAAKGIWNLQIGRAYERGGALDPFYEADATSYCVNIRAYNNSPDGQTWAVDAVYEPIDPQEFSNFENPLAAPVEIRIGSVKFERPIDYDYSSTPKAIVNSAGDPFDPGVTRDDSRTVITINRNEAIYAGQAVGGVLWTDTKPETYNDTINSASVFGRAAHTVKLDNIEGEYQWHPSLCDPGSGYSGYYVRATYVFAVNREKWDKQLIDRGYRTRDATTPYASHQIVIDGYPATDPVHLNGSGAVLAPDATTHKIIPVYLPSSTTGFQIYPEVDHASALVFPS